ncbi:hypothetical protein O181_041334 [Austropuccinia psidii MF-1]|uniref:Phospholipid/glycerol acyltransferase domain-containing protein n=1 Tax=Austropuccinia psidii MF-1 TaxID=1389203 RepID=A0A9Q3DE00_9BASI|nr:hypothetical protein [Austropuccinia psidii MF-1]
MNHQPKSSTSSSIVSIPLNQRSSKSKSTLRLIIFNIYFFVCIVTLHVTQLVVFPFVFCSHNLAQISLKYNRLAKETFTIILVSITQIFGPTNLVITTDSNLDLGKLIKLDSNGKIKSIQLPRRSVIVANHQIYADWLYIWCLAYLANLHGSLVIILKASLKWVPIVGPAMQLFSFIFLNRSWSSDKSSLSEQLDKLADQATRQDAIQSQSLDKLALLIFPEGTLVSPATRPLSKKYADKFGYSDLRHCLLPRSTGSLFCIRALSRKVPDLKLIDLTIGYPGIPPDGYGQDYYTLQSIFGYGHPPPEVHIHLRIIPVSEIPIGTSHLQQASSDHEALGGMVDSTYEEVQEFDQWLREHWAKKDDMLAKFYKDGVMCEAPKEADVLRRIQFKVELRGIWDSVRTIGLCVPGGILIWIALLKLNHNEYT